MGTVNERLIPSMTHDTSQFVLSTNLKVISFFVLKLFHSLVSVKSEYMFSGTPPLISHALKVVMVPYQLKCGPPFLKRVSAETAPTLLSILFVTISLALSPLHVK